MSKNPFQHRLTQIDRGRLPVDNDLEPRTLEITPEGNLVNKVLLYDANGIPLVFESNGGVPGQLSMNTALSCLQDMGLLLVSN